MTTKKISDILEFDELDSTQIFARSLISSGKAKHGLTIVAKKQTGGIGRLNRSWISPEGGLWLTSIFLKHLPLEFFSGFSIRLGLKIIDELEKIIPLKFLIKWPNDIILENKKVGGILIEFNSSNNFVNHLIIGIGINVNNNIDSFPQEIRINATTIKTILKKDIPLEKVLASVITAQKKFLTEIARSNLPDIRELWKKRSYTHNQNIRILSDGKIVEGKEQGITDHGELMVKLATGGSIIFTTGDVELLRKI